MTVLTLQYVRSDENVELFWKKVTKMASIYMYIISNLDVSDPVLPHHRKRPRRYSGDFPTDICSLYQPIYFNALEMVICGIQICFDQTGYKLYVKMEHLLLKAANKEEFEEEFKFITNFYKEDFNEDQLKLQLSVMSTNLPADPTPQTHFQFSSS